MAAVNQHHLRLAKSLDPRLLRFFTKFPPPQIAPDLYQQPPAEQITTAPLTSPSDPNASTTETTSDPPSPYESQLTNANGKKLHPFLPFRNPSTGNWHAPTYSLRRQSILFKLAQKHNVLPLMPLCPKHPEVKALRREEGLKMKGTGVGQRVKGHKWERTLRGRLEERRRAMEAMPGMIREWKRLGHGRGWKKWPSGRSKS
jgi:large subunit ribosomal protein L25